VGRQAHEAAVASSADLNHEDPHVILRDDIRKVFDMRGSDRIFRQTSESMRRTILISTRTWPSACEARAMGEA